MRSQLEAERGTFKSHWNDLSQYISPRRSRFFVQDANKGDKRNQKIIDSTGTLAARTMRAGMMSGITSPARPWFKLSTTQASYKDSEEVKTWLQDVTSEMVGFFIRSNLYNVLPIIYGDLGIFGTACMIVEEDFSGDVINCQSFPIGSYMISANEKGKIDTFFREFQMTVRQLIQKFGMLPNGEINWDNLSTQVRYLWDAGQLEAWIEVAHAIYPNDDWDENKPNSKNKKYASVYYERGAIGSSIGFTGGASVDNKFLRESGYDIFPVLAPRWEVAGEDVYGTSCPGMDALGDIKQLQMGEKRSAQAIEKQINPPMIGPTSLRSQKASVLPGDITYLDEDQNKKLRSVYDIQFNIAQLEAKQAQIRQRVSRCFYEDLFLMLANSDRRQITAREIDERHEEKLLALGPVLEQLNQDVLDPLIELGFAIGMKKGLFPPPPEELQGAPLKVEYVSILAQAQKMVALGAIDKFTIYVSNLMQVSPGISDKIDFDQLIDVYGEITSIPEGIVRSDETASEIRQQRAMAQQEQMQQQQAAQQAINAKNLSQANLGTDNALSAMTRGAPSEEEQSYAG